MPRGELTARVALSIQQEFENNGFFVLHDHRSLDPDSSEKVRELHVFFGEAPNRETILADLDIAIISKNDMVIALIEIEETTDKPKVILGDILAILLGNGITDKNKKAYKVGKWTTLIVMSHGSHHERTAFISEQTNILKENLKTHDKTIGQIIVENFADEEQLEETLKHHVTMAIDNYKNRNM